MNNRMVTEEYSKAVAEVLIILKLIPFDKMEKLPKKLIVFLEEVSAKEYKPNIKYSQNISQMNLMPKTIDILAMLYINYWCTETERKQLDLIMGENEARYQEEIHQKYKTEDIFKKTETKEVLPAIIKKEKWYEKFFNNMKKLLSRKKRKNIE